MEKQILKFRSKRDWLIGIVYFIFALAIILIWAIPYNTTISSKFFLKITATSMITIVMIVFTWAVFSTYYLLTDKYLACFSGPFSSKIFYSDIKDIKKVRNGWSSLALSFDRVEINCGKSILKRKFISPKYKDLFIEELKKRLPNKEKYE